MGAVVLDTNVIIYLMKGQLTSQFDDEELCVSVITEMELLSYHGLNDETEFPLRHFLQFIRCVEIDKDVKKEAIRLRRKTRLKLADAIIVATALVLNAELITNDSTLLALTEIRVSAPQLK